MISLALCVDGRTRPWGSLSNNLILQFREPLYQGSHATVIRHARPQAGIAKRDARVAYQATPFGALDGASAKQLAKVSFVQPEEPLQPREVERFVLRLQRSAGAIFFRRRENSRLELRSGDNRCAPVPRTNILANVA